MNPSKQIVTSSTQTKKRPNKGQGRLPLSNDPLQKSIFWAMTEICLSLEKISGEYLD